MAKNAYILKNDMKLYKASVEKELESSIILDHKGTKIHAVNVEQNEICKSANINPNSKVYKTDNDEMVFLDETEGLQYLHEACHKTLQNLEKKYGDLLN